MDIKILVVDDDKWITKVLAKIIMNLNFTSVFVVHNGFDAVAMALKEKPDLIFLDLMMPELDGLTTLKLLKTIPNTQDAKVIVCTANNDMDNLAKVLKLGAADFISKPFTPETIKEKIDSILSKMDSIVSDTTENNYFPKL